ncbi:14839_t:CDS:2, partial [Cetraspora pellucida]
LPLQPEQELPKTYKANLIFDKNQDLKDSNYERAKNCKEKILYSPKYEAQQERDFVIDTYFKHLSELELRVKKCTNFYLNKECIKCKNQLIEPKDFDLESLSQESQVSSCSTNTYHETDTDDFIECDKFTYLKNQNGIVLNDKLYFSDSELRIDDSSSSKCNSL